MNCRDIEEFAPLYLSGEMEERQRAQFQSHLTQCRGCAAEIDRQIALDARLRQVVAELPDATAVQRSVRGRMAREKYRRLAAVAAIAAMMAFAAVSSSTAATAKIGSP